MFKGIDLFSDTVTQPTIAMKQAMLAAPLGDEQKGEDPTTKKLEEMAAELLGYEAALFFPSATMANEIAIRLLTEPGEELLAAENCHLFFAEAGGPAILSGVMTRPIATDTGIFTADQLYNTFRFAQGPHYPVSKLVSIENTTNMGGGIAWEKQVLETVLATARKLNLHAHLDGSRLFNAVVKTGSTAQKQAAGFDTVTLCLSKGLGCPVGALLLFRQENFPKVRRLKQLWGGAMRQSGILAAAGIYALQNHIERLAEDHYNAERLAEKIAEIPQITVENHANSTNMVFFTWQDSKLTALQFNDQCISKGLRFSQVGANRFRAVTHLDVSTADIDHAIKILHDIAKN